MFRNQFKNIWDKELFHLVREFFTKRIHHFNGNINDETTVYHVMSIAALDGFPLGDV
jgi:hypothetical protein